MKRLFAAIVALCLILLAASPAAADLSAGSAPRLQTADGEVPPAFRVIGLEDRPGLAEAVTMTTLRARLRVMAQSDIDWPGTALIVWTPEREFFERTGHHPENAPAAASPSARTVWINAAAWSRATEAERATTMTHELAHLLVGSLPGGPGLPLWAHEGLAMHLAQEGSLEGRMKLMQARLFSQLPALGSLERQFPTGGEGRALAYQMSFATVELVAQSLGDDPGEVRRLVRRLSHPEKGPRFAEDFRDEFVREGWGRALELSLGSRFTTGVIVLSSGGAILFLIAILVVIAVVRLKRRTGSWNEREQDDEAWAESLTDEDVQEVWGDREDRWNHEPEGPWRDPD